MNFNKASTIESLVWQLRLADYKRSSDRALINDLFNGVSPYTAQEEKINNIEVNVNFLEGTKLAHDARGQFSNAFTKPGRFFTAHTDMGQPHKRQQRSSIVTNEVN